MKATMTSSWRWCTNAGWRTRTPNQVNLQIVYWLFFLLGTFCYYQKVQRDLHFSVNTAHRLRGIQCPSIPPLHTFCITLRKNWHFHISATLFQFMLPTRGGLAARQTPHWTQSGGLTMRGDEENIFRLWLINKCLKFVKNVHLWISNLICRDRYLCQIQLIHTGRVAQVFFLFICALLHTLCPMPITTKK